MNSLNPTRDEFAALLEQSFEETELQEGSVVTGKVVAIEKDLAVIDVGLKVEGRIQLKEFGIKGRDGDDAGVSVGDTVEV
ncbi:MAG: S1 RNA-binding domain-containing protein, partial [Alphaproteobacteria bacterium]|nr:S1 RNA-binding domain-containing protein [Alphaproteobacteria bacterium]